MNLNSFCMYILEEVQSLYFFRLSQKNTNKVKRDLKAQRNLFTFINIKNTHISHNKSSLRVFFFWDLHVFSSPFDLIKRVKKIRKTFFSTFKTCHFHMRRIYSRKNVFNDEILSRYSII